MASHGTISPVAVEILPPIAQITLHRPPVNALDAEMLDHFERALEQIECRKDVSVVLLRSRQQVFCAGADLLMIGSLLEMSRPGEALQAYARRLQRMINRFEALPAATVCAMDGVAAGGGFEIALAADFRLGSDRVRLSLPELALGLIPAAGGTQRLVRLAGLSVARRVILRGAVLDAQQAQSFGIVDEVFSTDDFEAAAETFVRELARGSPRALKAAKLCLREAGPLTSSGLVAELGEIAHLIEGPDTRQRLSRFLDRAERAAQQGRI
jgi:enoyl-CoA hydratase